MVQVFTDVLVLHSKYKSPMTGIHAQLHTLYYCLSWPDLWGFISHINIELTFIIRLVPDFSSGKSRIRPFFGNPAKFLARFAGCQCRYSTFS